MTPKEYKGKTVIHSLTSNFFVVTGGQKRKSGWYFKDELGNLYPVEECEPLDSLEFNVRMLKSFATPDQFSDFFQHIGQEQFVAAWQKLEGNSVDFAVAVIAAGYLDCWEQFTLLTEIYGVSQEASGELNQRFRELIKQKNLNGLVAQWYVQNQAKKETA